MSVDQLNMFESVHDQTRLPTGNCSMVQYGIQNEMSDFRAHVTYPIMRTYVFPTDKARSLIEQADHFGLVMKTIKTGTIETAQGYPVPLSYIEGLQEIVIPPDVWRANFIDKAMPTSTKGTIATSIVVALLKKDMVPLPVRLQHADSKALQISGTDIIVNASLHLQVKCDMPGGERRYGGSGNLFIQIAECNPYRRH